MKIYDSDSELIISRKIHLHDYIMTQLTFDRIKNEMMIHLISDGCTPYPKVLKFFNVVGFEMSSCDFWGSSPHIFDFEYVCHDKRSVLPSLHRLGQEYGTIDPFCKILDTLDYIETRFTFSSGDRLNIACEYIVVT